MGFGFRVVSRGPRCAAPHRSAWYDGGVAIYSIGHGNTETERFLGLLELHNIALLVDVRSIPYSRYATWFGREALEATVNASGHTKYVYRGDQLGGKTLVAASGEGGPSDWRKMRQLPALRPALEKIARHAVESKANVVLMCAEEDPERCHRYHVLSEVLRELGHDVLHIRHSGEVVPHSELRRRMAEQPRLV